MSGSNITQDVPNNGEPSVLSVKDQTIEEIIKKAASTFKKKEKKSNSKKKHVKIENKNRHRKIIKCKLSYN